MKERDYPHSSLNQQSSMAVSPEAAKSAFRNPQEYTDKLTHYCHRYSRTTAVPEMLTMSIPPPWPMLMFS